MSLDVLKLVEGAPVPSHDGYLTLEGAAAAIGVRVFDLLQGAANRELALHARLTSVQGHLIDPDSLALEHPELGRRSGLVIPAPKQMPTHAIEKQLSGILRIADSAGCAEAALTQGLGEISIVALEAPGMPGLWFAPEIPVELPVVKLEVSALDLEVLRNGMAAKVAPERLEHARAARNGSTGARPPAAGKWAGKRFSWAAEQYCSRADGLPHSLADPHEQRQRLQGLKLFSEFMGDRLLGEIDSDLLRAFRDGPLKELPDHANRLSKAFRRGTMTETIGALKAANPGYRRMSLAQQQERMQWLFRLFAWLVKHEYLATNPTVPLHGHTGLSKADRIAAARTGSGEDDDGRRPFSDDELRLIFSQPQYQTGDGMGVTKGNRAWRPFHYWLPLLGLYAGGRIKELAQLHLADVAQDDGVWCISVNQKSPDKTLKTAASARLVPIHSVLLNLGFVRYCERLRAAGYQRVFPELTYSETPARYAKEAKRSMSKMLEELGMVRDNTMVFHNFRKNLNDSLARVPDSALGLVDAQVRVYMRYKLMGHQLPKDVNAAHYTSTTSRELASLVNGVSYPLPKVCEFDIESGLECVRQALDRKLGSRRGREDMGPFNVKSLFKEGEP